METIEVNVVESFRLDKETFSSFKRKLSIGSFPSDKVGLLMKITDSLDVNKIKASFNGDPY